MKEKYINYKKLIEDYLDANKENDFDTIIKTIKLKTNRNYVCRFIYRKIDRDKVNLSGAMFHEIIKKTYKSYLIYTSLKFKGNLKGTK